MSATPAIVKCSATVRRLASNRGMQVTTFEGGHHLLSSELFVRNPMWRVTLWPNETHTLYEVTLWVAGHAQERPGRRAVLNLREAMDEAERIFKSRDAAERLGARSST